MTHLVFQLTDHVSEVYENERVTTTLRCGIPEKNTRSQVTRMIWLQDMKRIVSSPGTDISDSVSCLSIISYMKDDLTLTSVISYDHSYDHFGQHS